MTMFYTHAGSERYFEFDGKICDNETGKELSVEEIIELLNKR